MNTQLDIARLGTILGVWAHPDDEAYLSAGVMAIARSNGQRVCVLTATRGERGTADPITWPPSRLGPLREQELERSLAILDVFEHAMLGHPDGGCANVPFGYGVAQVATAIESVRPDTILTFGPDGFTGHDDHRTVSAWVDAAVEATHSDAAVLRATTTTRHLTEFDDVHQAFDVFFAGQPSITEQSDLAVGGPLEPPIVDRKLAALRAQASQTTMLIDGVGADRFRSWVAAEYFVDAEVQRRADLAFAS